MGFDFLVDIAALITTGAYLISLFSVKVKDFFKSISLSSTSVMAQR